MMTQAYPIASIIAGLIGAYVCATVVGALIAKLGFPLHGGNRIGALDGLRGYLALSVLAHHFVIWMQVTQLDGGWTAPPVNMFNNLGAGGVALFFMTTGCVFYPRILAGFRANSWVAIYVGRIFRIIPLIVFSVFIVTCVIWLRTGYRMDAAYPKAAAIWISSWSEPPLLGYQDSGRINAYVLWSLRYEWLFYLFILPVCAVAIDLLRRRLPSFSVPVGLMLVSFALRMHGDMVDLMTFLPLFAVGMLGFECQRQEGIRRLLQSRWASLLAFASLILAMVSAPTPYEPLQVALYGFFFICITCGNDMAGLLRARGALVLGECSYGIYLLHGIVLSLLFVDAGRMLRAFSAVETPALLPLVAVVVTGATALSYLWIERFGIRFGRAIVTRRLRADAKSVSPYAERAAQDHGGDAFQNGVGLRCSAQGASIGDKTGRLQ
jgi:peptidoglycan/LPS O-acetylase OafA/YrhL